MKRLLGATLASLGNHNYRLYFFGQTVSTIGTWAQKIAQAWLVLELTDSSFALGLTIALQALPILLLGPWAGLIADRHDKHRILILTSCAAIVPAVVIGVVTVTDQATIWVVMAAVTVAGIVEAFDKPTRQAFVIEMVGREHLVNAITLNNIIFNAGRLVGPAVAGILIVAVGMPATFFVNAASFLAVLLALLVMRKKDLQPSQRAARSKGQLREGFRYVSSDPNLLGPLLLLTITGLLAWEWTVTIPLLARDAFSGDPQVVGAMFTAMGGGAILGTLMIAGLLKATNARLITSSLVFAVLLGLVAVVPWLPVSYALLFLLGSAGTAYRTITTSIAQLRSVPDMRGRTMALFMMATVGMSPISGPLLGWLCEVVGVRETLLIGSISCTVTALLVLLYLRRAERRAPRVTHGSDVTAEPSPPVVDARDRS